MVLPADSVGVFAGAVALGAVHGVEPGHGWPVAASYALDRSNKWLYGFAASLIIGVGHLVSSIAMVAVFFYAKSYFSLTEVNEPIALEVLGATVTIGGPVSIVAGILLLLLGWREYAHGHSHGDDGHDHSHGDDGHDHSHGEGGHDHSHGEGGHDHSHEHGHAHDHSHGDEHEEEDGTLHSHDDLGLLGRVLSAIPFVGSDHTHDHAGAAADRGLLGIAWFAFVLGFAHEEEFEIIALCAGSDYCLELMLAYALTVITGIVGLTLLLIAGYQHYEDRVKRYTPYLPLFSAAVLVVMGLGFIVGVF